MMRKNIFVLVLIVLIGLGVYTGYKFVFSDKQHDLATEEGQKILYWTCGMHPSVRANKPGRCPICGMDLVPVYEEKETAHDKMEMEQPKGPVVKLTQDQIALVGVKTTPAKVVPLFQQIRAVGIVAYDPKLVVAEEEFIAALEAKDDNMAKLAKRKLMILGLSVAQIDKLETEKKTETNLLLPEETMWVYADLYENELAWVKAGQKVELKSVSYPEVTFKGEVKSLEPILESKTRSNRLRILVNNPELKLKPQMYVDVYLKSNTKHRLAVPKQAVLATGTRSLVYVDYGKGRYQAREVVTGSEGYLAHKGEKQLFVPVVKGLKKGEKVVTAANFLIDSQSQLIGGQSALYGGASEVHHH